MAMHNARPYVGQAVASVLAQRYDDWELIAWDDASEDGSLEVARDAAAGDPRVLFHRHDTNLGLTATLNRAFATARGSYFGTLDADDRLLPAALQRTVAVLDRRPQVGLAYTRYRVIDAHGQPGPVGSRCLIPYDPNRLLIDFMVHHLRLFRRQHYERLDGFDERYRCAQDYEFCLRMSETTRFEQVKEVLYEYRVHDRSVSATRRAEQRDCAARAVRAALVRRGMGSQFSLHVEPDGGFRLRKIAPAGEPSR